jgi:hypothetical protein
MIPKLLQGNTALEIPYSIPDTGVLSIDVDSGEPVNVLVFNKDEYSAIGEAAQISRGQQQHHLTVTGKPGEKRLVVVENPGAQTASVVFNASTGSALTAGAALASGAAAVATGAASGVVATAVTATSAATAALATTAAVGAAIFAPIILPVVGIIGLWKMLRSKD